MEALQPQAQDVAVEEALPEESQESIQRLDALGLTLAKKRSEAIAAREASGIEEQWLEDEEFYQGIDDLNRNEFSRAWRTKPPGQYQPQTAKTTRSTVFVNITQQYCNASAARIADMLLPSDDKNFKILPTPIPDLMALSKGQVPPGLMRQANAAFPGQPDVAQQKIAEATQNAMAQIDQAKAAAGKAETRIEDWLVESQWHAEVRKVIEDSARIGTGVLKGPMPIKSRQIAFENGTLIVKTEINPGSKRIDPWNFYPDGACGETIHNGAYTWERDHLTERQLEELKGSLGYIESQIDLCLQEGPHKAIATKKDIADETIAPALNDRRFEIWYFHGFVGKEDLEAAGCECGDGETPSIPAMLTMVNNRVIRASLNPLDSGDFPYDVMPWSRKQALPWGNGVARQGRTAQRIVNAGVRNMMDNGGLSAGPQIVLMDDVITSADGSSVIGPRKVWRLSSSGSVDDVRKAMAFFEIPSRQKELMEIVQFGLKMMEDSTGLPMLLQGQLGKAPDTVGGMTMLNNNATAVLRRLARTFDDCITEPHIRRYYTWILQYGEDGEKGDFTIDARGSSALVERDIQAQQLPQLWQLSQSPTSKLDPTKVAREIVKSLKFDPKSLEYDDEKWEQIVASLSQKTDPRAEVEKMRQEGESQRLEMKLHAEAKEGKADREVKVMVALIDEKLATAELSATERQELEKLKTSLAETTMELTTQKQLSAASLAAGAHRDATKQVKQPKVEPAGRAPEGQAYQR